MYANLPDTHAIWTWVLWADENNSFQGTFLYFLFIESIFHIDEVQLQLHLHA